MKKFTFLVFLLVLTNCVQQNAKPDAYKNVNSRLKNSEVEKVTPKANINELEIEVNNGGFNQYFINSGQNCYATLNKLRENKKFETAKLLEKAINLINPEDFPEEVFIEKLRKREVETLYNESIDIELNKLDELFYKYPDGNLTK